MTWALQDAKSRFSAVVNKTCKDGPQIVTRRGKPVAVLISYSDYSRIDPTRKTAVDILLGGPTIDGAARVGRVREHPFFASAADDGESVESKVESLRKGRFDDI